MQSLSLVLSFAFGTCIGSFLNVLVLRYGVRSVVGGRSTCVVCGAPLHWFELIPLVSFFCQRGRCRACTRRISWQYPIVELITGLVFAAVVWRNLHPTTYLPAQTGNLPPETSFFWWLVVGGELLVWSLLIALSVYDLRHKLIPDAFVYTAVLASFFIMFVRGDALALNGWGSILLAAPFAALWLFSRGRWMGLGDAKLLLLFSPLLGLAKGLSALLVGFWIGALVALAGLALKGLVFAMPEASPSLKSRLKNLTMKTALPLAPFLVFGLFIVYLFGIDVTGLGMLLQ